MGGCASKPKELDCPPASLPVEKPSGNELSVTNAKDETTVQEDSNGGESQKEEPLVDLSEPNLEKPKTDGDESTDSNNPILELASAIDNPTVADQVTSNQTEESIADGNETLEQIKDGPGEAEPAEGKTEETPKSNTAENQQVSNSLDSEEKN